MRFVTFDLSFLAGSASFTQRSHDMGLWHEAKLGRIIGPRLRTRHEKVLWKKGEKKIEPGKLAHNCMFWGDLAQELINLESSVESNKLAQKPLE